MTDRLQLASVDALRDAFHTTWVDRSDLTGMLTPQAYRAQILEALHTVKRLGNWQTLSEVCGGAIVPGRGPIYASIGEPCLKTKNVQSILVDDRTEVFVDAGFASLNSRLAVYRGSLLMNLSGAGSIGRVGIYLGPGRAFTNQHIVRLDVDAAYDAAFVAVFLSSWWGERAIEQGISGSTGQLWINQDQVREIPVPLPDPAIQRAIGNKVRKANRLRELAVKFEAVAWARLAELGDDLELDGLVRDSLPVDAARDTFHTSFVQPSQVTASLAAPSYRTEVLQVHESIARCPTSSQLREVVAVPVRQGATPTYSDTGSPTLKTKHVRGLFVDSSAPAYCTSEHAAASPSSSIRNGDVLVVRQGAGSIGRCGVYLGEQELMISDSLFKVRTLPGHDSAYLALFLSSWAGRRLLERGIQGSTGQLTLGQRFLSRVPVPIPHSQRQQTIGDMVRKAFDCQASARRALVEAGQAVESFVDGTLDQHTLLAEGGEIVQWLAKNPRPDETENA